MKHIPLDADWVVGFTDAEGCFSLSKSRTTLRCRFIISQDARSKNVLFALQAFFGVGSVHKAGGTMWEYYVGSLTDLHTVILPFFAQEAHRLLTSKYYDWLRLQSAVLTLSSLLRSQRKTVCLEQFHIATFSTAPIPNRVMTAAWLRGFIDGEGCFAVSIAKQYPIPQFVIGVHSRDWAICQAIQAFLRCGVVYKRKNGVAIYQLSRRDDLVESLFPILYRNGNCHRLCTQKRYSLSLFRRIVLAMAGKGSQQPATMAKIVMWKQRMRFSFDASRR